MQDEGEDIFVDVDGIRFIANTDFAAIYGEKYTITFEEGRFQVRGI